MTLSRAWALAAGIPRASVRFAHCALRLPGGSLALTAACRSNTVAASFDGIPRTTAASSSRRRFAPRSSRYRLRRAPGDAPPAAVLAALVRALLRSATALRFAPRRAPVPAPVRTPPPSPSAACCARLPAAPGAPSAIHSPGRLPSVGSADVDSPNSGSAHLAVPTARGGLGSHTPRSMPRVRAFGAYGVPLRTLAASSDAALLLDRVYAPVRTP